MKKTNRKGRFKKKGSNQSTDHLLCFVPTFDVLACLIMGKPETQQFGKQHCREFSSFFGTTRAICSILWVMINKKNNYVLPRGASPKHLLWGLFFMKTYSNETIISSRLQVDPKTARKWIWWAADEIAKLADDVVCFINNIYFH